MSGLFISFVRRFKIIVIFNSQKANNTPYAHDDIWQPLYWCRKTVKRRTWCCTKPILWQFNSFVM